MIDLNQELEPENLSQKDIMTFLLHSSQHTATREELQDVKKELKTEIQEVRTELKAEIQEVKKELKAEIQDVKKELKEDISKVNMRIDKLDNKFDRVQWLIVATILTVLSKDYILGLLK
jgi:Skp family chaperone for outer membrane proteins